MRIGHIELFVRNPAESRAFYERVLGFEVKAVQGQLVWLKLGDSEILLRPGSNPSSAQQYRDAASGIVLYTDNLDATLAPLRSRGLELRGDDGEECPTFHGPGRPLVPDSEFERPIVEQVRGPASRRIMINDSCHRQL